MDGEFTPTGEMFDLGYTCKQSIIDYHSHGKNSSECGQCSEYSNGNGSLMRIHPFALLLADKELSISDKLDIIYSASALTHAHERSKIGCGIYALILWELLKKACKESIYQGLVQAWDMLSGSNELNAYNRIFKDNFSQLSVEAIKSGGYVVDMLEAALWCLLTTSSYREYVLKAVNLGDDTDTVAAVVGGLAGVLYGLDAIPTEWLDTLIKRNYIEDMCERAFAAWSGKDKC